MQDLGDHDLWAPHVSFHRALEHLQWQVHEDPCRLAGDEMGRKRKWREKMARILQRAH